MLDILLTALCFSGFVYAATRWLKIELCNAPIFSISFICLLLFLFALSDLLKPGSMFLMYFGFALSGAGIVDIWNTRRRGREVPFSQSLFATLFCLIIISFVVSIGMKYTVIDDYVYWGVIGKYLYLNHHLPDADTTIIARHLAYTPGTSIFHYFIYTLTGKYSQAISYFAQNILLVSALFVVLKKEALKRTIILLCILVILLTLFSGSIFTKLQVDYLLSIYFFALLWSYFQKKRINWSTLFAICLPICFIFLIKEIGFALGILILFIIFFDLLFHDELGRKKKIKFVLFVIFNGCILFLLKHLWTAHCQEMGFLKFNSAVNIDSIKHSFAVFSDEHVRKGFLIYIKAVVIGPADRLNLPYLFWYVLIVFCWIRIFKDRSTAFKLRYFRLIKILSGFFVVYLVLMYFMQVIIFGVGKGYDHAVGLTRYMNIFFSQIVFFTILSYSQQFFFKKDVLNKIVISFVALVILALGLSRVETSLRREDHYIKAEKIAAKISESIDINKNYKICLIPGRNDNHLGIKLLYHLLPTRINHGRFPVKDKDSFLSSLLDFDYVLFHYPEKDLKDWIRPLMYEVMDEKVESQSFFKIDQSETGVPQFEKVFEIRQDLK